MNSQITLTLTPESDGLHGYGYDPVSQKLAVEFEANHAERTYHYLKVPPAMAADLEAASSKTAFVMRNIKPKYQVERLEKSS
jgi:hypothetical protein